MPRLKNFDDILSKAKSGDTESLYHLGMAYELALGVEQDLSKAFDYYSQAANAQHPQAQYNLALCYALEKGTKKDLQQAKYWIRKANENGYSTPQGGTEQSGGSVF